MILRVSTSRAQGNTDETDVHGFNGADVLRGFGGASAKSEALLRVSVHPFAARVAAFVLLAAGAGPVPLKQFAVLP